MLDILISWKTFDCMLSFLANQFHGLKISDSLSPVKKINDYEKPLAESDALDNKKAILHYQILFTSAIIIFLFFYHSSET